MPYPFIYFPSLGEFVSRVTSSEYGARIETMNISGPRGEAEVQILIRDSNKKNKRMAVIPDLKNEDILTPHVLRSLCVQLDIPPKDFGLHLD